MFSGKSIILSYLYCQETTNSGSICVKYARPFADVILYIEASSTIFQVISKLQVYIYLIWWTYGNTFDQGCIYCIPRVQKLKVKIQFCQ